MKYIIGVDFDNTILCYDNLLHKIAVERGLINPRIKKSKKHIRDKIRQLPDGEIEWQKLQAMVYGRRIGEAELIDGVWTFFRSCKRHNVKVYIISHKSEFAKLDQTGTNLRAAALSWMAKNKFFETNGLGLWQKDVYFESTRQEKIERIKKIQCTHFIDDLEETFLEDTFPTGIEKIFYMPHTEHSAVQGVRVAASWKEIKDYVFGSSI